MVIINITVEKNKYKEISKINRGDVVYFVGGYYIVTGITDREDEMVLIDLSSGETVSVYEDELIRYINDKEDNTMLVTEAELVIYGHLNENSPKIIKSIKGTFYLGNSE